MTKLAVFTIVLDGIYFLPAQFFTLSRLSFDIDWHWYIVEGAAANTGSTKWCRPQQPRLSKDGTTEFIRSLAGHPRIHIDQREYWPGGKDEMVNAALAHIKEPSVLLQCDADEMWTPEQIEKICAIFATTDATQLLFDCVFHVGPNLVITSKNTYGGRRGEWARAFRFEPGMTMRHEPPILTSPNGRIQTARIMPNEETRKRGLVFHHYAYCFESQVKYKEAYYGYSDAVFHWTRLQNHQGPWPVKLRDYLHWSDDDATVDRLHQI